MADLILGSAVDSITRQLLSLGTREIGPAWGVKRELEKLQSTVSAITALLREAEKSQVEAEEVKDWLRKLKDVVYDAEDLLDDLSTEGLRNQRVIRGCKRFLNEVHNFFSSSNPLIFSRKIARRVKDIREKLDAIVRDRDNFKFSGNTSNTLRSLVAKEVKPQTYPFEYKEYVIGREKDRKEVIEFLLNHHSEENVSVLPIVGLGGLGKTTLARLVFNDESVNEYFTLKLWVCVSTKFSVEDILRKIVRECTENKELANLDMNELRRNLGKELDGKRFLLVLDDVWNENRRKWLELQGFLMNGAKGSKILVTTRTPRVALTMSPMFHKLSCLSEDESLSLLMQVAMKQEHEWRDQNLETVAKEILKKCAGAPLAITTMGRLLLFSRNTEEDWLNFKNNDLSRIDQEEGDIMPSLKLSYDFLPSHLKQCFAYCSLFPKDYELDPSELICLWMAQGFVKSPGNRKTFEEVGREYFMELASRSLFQDLKEDIYGNIIGCKMHDLMHDLAVLVAEDNCFTIDGSHVRKVPEGTRHVPIVDVEDYLRKGFERSRRIRSLLLTADNSRRIEVPHLDISYFRNLRALHLRNAHIKVISSSLGKLKNLRSLDLSGNSELRFLPTSISSLSNLETLNLRDCRNLRNLPAGITKLINLRQLDVKSCSKLMHMPRGIEKLTSLQMLGRFVVGERGSSNAARLNELGRLTGLRKELNIKNLERLGIIPDEVDASFSLEKFELQSLGLHWKYAVEDYGATDEEVSKRLQPHPRLKGLKIQGYGGVKLPSWVPQLHGLIGIKLVNCSRCRHLPPLDQLPFLKRISLVDMGNLEWIELSEMGVLQRSFFPSLEDLKLYSLFKFRGWERRDNVGRIEEDIGEEEGSSSLSTLPSFSDKVKVTIVDCPRFSCMQGQRLRIGVSRMKNLQQLQEDLVRHTPHPVALRSPMAIPNPSMMMLTSISSICHSALTSLSIDAVEGLHLPTELFQSVPSLQSLVISRCPRLQSLRVKTILQCLTALVTLEISWCKELDLSTNDGGGDGEGVSHLQLHGHHKLCHLRIEGIGKMESLPGWFQHLSNLCKLKLSSCPKLDWTGESENQEDNPNLQSFGPTKLQKLKIQDIEKMKTLPWWIQHQTKLESLTLAHCQNLMALPEWFPQLNSLKFLRVYDCSKLSRRCQSNTGEDWPKISHIQRLQIC